MAPDPTVVLEGVEKVYRTGAAAVQALRGIDLVVDRGDFACVSGPSGSGKTTLLNLIGALDRPTAGRVRLDGRDLGALSSTELSRLRLRRVGFVFQAYNLIPVLSARENVEFVMQVQGLGASERADKARGIMGEVGLAGLEDRRPAELSGGQQQRLAVARAIVSEPSLVLADEPTANLDSETAENLMGLLRRMNQERGVTFIFSTHDPRVMDYSRRLIALRDGRIETDEKKS